MLLFWKRSMTSASGFLMYLIRIPRECLLSDHIFCLLRCHDKFCHNLLVILGVGNIFQLFIVSLSCKSVVKQAFFGIQLPKIVVELKENLIRLEINTI